MPDRPEGFEPDRWVPSPASLNLRAVSRLMHRHGLASYPALLARAVEDPDWFYPVAFEDLGLGWMHPVQTVLDERDGPPWPHWFVGGKTNAAWLCAERWVGSGRTAVIWEAEDGTARTLSFDQLDGEIARAAAGLRSLGVRPGDVVALHLPMIPEAVIAMLAAARLGAIAQPSFSGYGPEALAERLRIGGARVLVTADGTLRRGAPVAMKEVADAAASGAACVERIVVVRRLGGPTPFDPRRDLWWDDLLRHPADGPCAPLDPEMPFLLAFTSGSSGRPKGAVHVHGGLPYRLAIDLAYGMDLHPGDRFSWVTDMGWIMGPIATIPPLALGAATVLIEGVPDHPTPDRLWRTVERHAITHLGLSPTVIRALAAHGDAWVDRHDLRPLRVLGSTGEPLNPSAWRWLHARVARGVLPIINLTGGTEVGGPLLSCSPMVPSREGRMAGPPPGIAVDVFSAAGTPVIGEVGDLVVTKSWPAMTKGFWREPERYLETYWSRWPGIWVHGDRAIRYEDGSWELVGRSDDVIKVAGKRVGPTEFEAVAAGVPGVAAAAAVGVPHDMKGEVAVVVIVPGAGIADPVALATQVGDRIASSMGKALRPAAVLPVEALPLTRSAKVHRRAVRAWLTGTDPGDLSTLDNPEAEAAITAARPRLREALER